jgi:hypothetical protein
LGSFVSTIGNRYTQIDWTDGVGGFYGPGTLYSPSGGTVTLTARWTAPQPEVIVTFDVGTPEAYLVTVAPGHSLNNLEGFAGDEFTLPKLDDFRSLYNDLIYTHIGWSPDGGVTVFAPESTYTLGVGLTLTARWEVEPLFAAQAELLAIAYTYIEDAFIMSGLTPLPGGPRAQEAINKAEADWKEAFRIEIEGATSPAEVEYLKVSYAGYDDDFWEGRARDEAVKALVEALNLMIIEVYSLHPTHHSHVLWDMLMVPFYNHAQVILSAPNSFTLLEIIGAVDDLFNAIEAIR